MRCHIYTIKYTILDVVTHRQQQIKQLWHGTWWNKPFILVYDRVQYKHLFIYFHCGKPTIYFPEHPFVVYVDVRKLKCSIKSFGWVHIAHWWVIIETEKSTKESVGIDVCILSSSHIIIYSFLLTTKDKWQMARSQHHINLQENVSEVENVLTLRTVNIYKVQFYSSYPFPMRSSTMTSEVSQNERE